MIIGSVQELRLEQQLADEDCVLLTEDDAERALVERLSSIHEMPPHIMTSSSSPGAISSPPFSPPFSPSGMGMVASAAANGLGPSPGAPIPYLVFVFEKAGEEMRRLPSARERGENEAVASAMNSVRDLCISYIVLLLNMPDMFPQPTEAAQRGKLQLLDILLGAYGGVPSGFLDALGSHFAANAETVDMMPNEEIDNLVFPTLDTLPSLVHGVSPLGNFHGPLHVLAMLAEHPIFAAAITRHPKWIPDARNGMLFEIQTILCPFLRISTVPDGLSKPQPSVQENCFGGIRERRQADVLSSISSLRRTLENLQVALHGIFLNLLRSRKGQLREKVLQWCAKLLQENKGRSKMQIDPMTSGTHGCFINFAGVMMKLSEPFLDPMNSKLARLDPNYLLKGRINYSEETKLALIEEGKARWVDGRNDSRIDNFRQMQDSPMEGETSLNVQTSNDESQASPSGRDFHFICECFFMTLEALHLGPIRAMSESTQLVRELQQRQMQLEGLQSSAEGNPTLARQIAQLQMVVSEMEEARLCYETALTDHSTLEKMFRFFKMVAVWILELANHNGDISVAKKSNDGPKFKLPLPDLPPRIFYDIPEYFVEDISQFFIFVGRMAPHAMREFSTDIKQLEEIFSFVITFMGSPNYVRNPYCRANLVEVLRMWMPDRRISSNPLSQMFEVLDLAQKHLTPNLLKLYVDIEFTGSHTQVRFRLLYRIPL